MFGMLGVSFLLNRDLTQEKRGFFRKFAGI